MLTPISTKIEEFKKKVEEVSNPFFEDNADGDVAYFGYKTLRTLENGTKERFTVTDFGNIEIFLHTVLQQRDEEWRELVSSLEQPGTHINYAEDNWHAGYNNACYDIITKSKGDMTTQTTVTTCTCKKLKKDKCVVGFCPLHGHDCTRQGC